MIGVTRLIDMLNKPSLINWANKLGLEGVSLDEHKLKVTRKGTSKHEMVENFFTKGVRFPGCEVLERQMEYYDFVGSEMEFDNGHIKCIADLVLRRKTDGAIIICDLKSSNRPYLSTKLQLSAYKHIFGADGIAFISLKDLIIRELDIDTRPYWDMVQRLYQIHELLNYTKEKL